MTVPEVISVQGTFVDDATHADVAVIVVTFNSASDVVRLMADLRAAALDRVIRVIVVDNQSADGTVAAVRMNADVTLIESGGNLGYAGGINVALRCTGPCDTVLILNPDLRVHPRAVDQMLTTLNSDDRIGVVVPRILDTAGQTYPSLRFEPTVVGIVGDALFGRRLFLSRPRRWSEFDYRTQSYEYSHEVDWATGAALLIRGSVARRLGEWDERFFLYSEETEYFRRLRDAGYVARYEPSAVVEHRLGGSGGSTALAALMAVNRIRYVEMHHGAAYSVLFRAAVAFSEALRSYDRAHRQTLGVVVDRKRWSELPRATRSIDAPALSGERRRGAVIVPAYNEALVIGRTLTPLSKAAVDGYIELIVVCNGCTDNTAEIARAVPGAQVVELDTGSKTLALNTGDRTATLWPRLYLDADIRITATTVLAVLDELRTGTALAARPAFRYGAEDASALVRSYYRARTRMAAHQGAIWWAGVYGLSERGHARFGHFPDVTGDDKFVDSQFANDEKTVVQTEPSVWVTPTDIAGLLTVLSRHHRGNIALSQQDPEGSPRTAKATALAVLRGVGGPRSAFDAVVYLAIAIATRWRADHRSMVWERDDTSRRSG